MEEDVEEDVEQQDHVKEKPEPELRIYTDDIKSKKHKKENNIMTFKKKYRFKDNYTRKLRLPLLLSSPPANLQPTL